MTAPARTYPSAELQTHEARLEALVRVCPVCCGLTLEAELCRSCRLNPYITATRKARP